MVNCLCQGPLLGLRPFGPLDKGESLANDTKGESDRKERDRSVEGEALIFDELLNLTL